MSVHVSPGLSGNCYLQELSQPAAIIRRFFPTCDVLPHLDLCAFRRLPPPSDASAVRYWSHWVDLCVKHMLDNTIPKQL